MDGAWRMGVARVVKVVTRGPRVLRGPEKYMLRFFLCFQFSSTYASRPAGSLLSLGCLSKKT